VDTEFKLKAPFTSCNPNLQIITQNAWYGDAVCKGATPLVDI
jgi:hypothetical protein